LTVELARLDEIMKTEGLVKGEHWDYERVTYDRKFSMVEGTFYLRVMGYAIEGDVGGRHAVLKLLTPLLGKYYYPHGVEYGGNEEFPVQVQQTSENILKRVKEKLDPLQV
jgi:hypothetical protein